MNTKIDIITGLSINTMYRFTMWTVLSWLLITVLA